MSCPLVRLPELRFLSLLDCRSDFSSCSWKLRWPPGGHRPKMDKKPSTMRERKPGCWRRATVAGGNGFGPEMNGRTDTHTHTQSANQTVGLGRAREDQEEDNMRPKRSGLGGTNIGASTPGPRYPLYSGVVFCPAKRRKRQVTRLLRPPPLPNRPFDVANTSFNALCIILWRPYLGYSHPSASPWMTRSSISEEVQIERDRRRRRKGNFWMPHRMRAACLALPFCFTKKPSCLAS